MRGLLVAIFVMAAALFPSAASAATIYVIRHLEKAAGDDPPLTSEGARRAAQLAHVLAPGNIKAVFATPTKRARETGEPLARQSGLSVSEYNPRDVDALAAAVKAVDASVLVVGHSNTVAGLVARFGGQRPAELTEQDYGTVYVVHSITDQVHQIPLN